MKPCLEQVKWKKTSLIIEWVTADGIEFERGIGSCGQCGGHITLASWATGRSIYSHTGEFGQEAESRVLTVQGELAISLQEIDKLQTQIAEYKEEMREARENMKALLKEVEEARAQTSGVVRSKETAEHRLDMAKEEVQFYSSDIQNMKADNMEVGGELKNTRTSLWELEHDLRKEETKLENDMHWIEELSHQV